MRITKDTKVVVSLANKQSSLGAAMHNAGYEVLGTNFVYIPITTDDCKNAIAGIRGLGIRGASVSIPHKQEVIRYLDKIDPVAKTIGAVNTVANDNGVLTGYNSDWIGAVAALKEVTNLNDKKAIVIGAGGAARAIVYGLTKNKAKVTVYNRTVDKGKELADSFRVSFGGDLKDVRKASDYDIVINTTSVGFGSDESLVDEEFFRPNTVAMDVVFVPAETEFLKKAKTAGCKIVPGYRMLIHQALFQMELFTGKKAPFDVMEKALLEVLQR